ALGLPQTLSARLANLAARPNVQSTLILSRQDGSIIQTTGLLAAQQQQEQEQRQAEADAQRKEAEQAATREKDEQLLGDAEGNHTTLPAGSRPSTSGSASSRHSHIPVPTTSIPAHPPSSSLQHASEPPANAAEPTPAASGARPPVAQTPYKPTYLESVAAHIFAFIASASSLSDALSHTTEQDPVTTTRTGDTTGASTTTRLATLDDAARTASDQQQAAGTAEGALANEGKAAVAIEDDVKMLRLRAQDREIIIIPDRKYLLCVVQDLTAGQTATTPTAGVAPASIPATLHRPN
ncbi:hypothetical protein KEM52_000357, partial [Ascosphaera acerosa]